MIPYENLEKLVGRRYTSLEALKADMEALVEYHVLCIIFSQSERISHCDFMIDYEFVTGDVRTLYYIKDNGGKMYITEV